MLIPIVYDDLTGLTANVIDISKLDEIWNIFLEWNLV